VIGKSHIGDNLIVDNPRYNPALPAGFANFYDFEFGLSREEGIIREVSESSTPLPELRIAEYLNQRKNIMARIPRSLATIVTSLFIFGGMIASQSAAQSSSERFAADVDKESPDPTDGLIQGAIKLQVDGEFVSGPELFRLGRFAEAERQFAWIANVRKGTTWGERGQYFMAECQFQQKKYVKALESFERLHTDYPATEYLEKLVSREYEIAQLWFAQSDPRAPADRKLPWMARLDGRLPTVDTQRSALRAVERVRHNDPSGPLADNAAIRIADYYMKQRDYDSAALYYKQIVAEYPKSRFLSHARLAAVEAQIRGYLEPERDTEVPNIARKLAKQILKIFAEFDDHGDRGGN
jgi:TolA-binding protein